MCVYMQVHIYHNHSRDTARMWAYIKVRTYHNHNCGNTQQGWIETPLTLLECGLPLDVSEGETIKGRHTGAQCISLFTTLHKQRLHHESRKS